MSIIWCEMVEYLGYDDSNQQSIQTESKNIDCIEWVA